ncbi:BTB/POZ protein [Rhizophagus clarus]|uniref:BTB/POZ protein n=1 Tax=Rhizophagus clarus TaxID=94130 RepID=A0A8H3QFY4_9GLOM|nr:BTB/POZ protein [Rhizophagus clarus]
MSSHLLEVIKDFERALEEEENCDVIIKAGEDSDELRAHSFVLRARCPYFKRALSDDWEEKDDDGNFIFKKPNIFPEVFQLILRYLYTGIADYSQHSKEMVLQCLVAADELGLDKLIDRIQEELINNEEFTYKDPVSTLNVIYQHEPFERLSRNY